MTGAGRQHHETRAEGEGPKLYRTCLVALMLLVAGLLTHLWGVSKTMRQAETLEGLRSERQALLKERERLTAEISGLTQSSRIRSIAEKQLGMVFPQEPPKNLYLGTAGTVRHKAQN